MLPHQNVKVAVIIHIGECAAAEHILSAQWGPRALTYLVETSLSVIVVQKRALLVCDAGLEFLDKFLYVSVGREYVLQAVQIVVQKHAPKRQELQARQTDPRAVGNIRHGPERFRRIQTQ